MLVKELKALLNGLDDYIDLSASYYNKEICKNCNICSEESCEDCGDSLVWLRIDNIETFGDNLIFRLDE